MKYNDKALGGIENGPTLQPKPYLLLAVPWAIFLFIIMLLVLFIMILSGGPIVDWLTNVIRSFVE